MEELIKNLKCNIYCLKRNKMYYIYILIVFFLLAFFDQKNNIYLTDVDDYFTRYIVQGCIIVFSLVFLVSLTIKESFFRFFDSIISINLKNFKNYFFSIFLILLMSAIIPFILGQFILYIFNYMHSGQVPTNLFIVNTIVVSMEIASAIFLIMALYLTIKKDILVYIIYFMILFILMISNNVYISMPLTINILELQGQGYYITFDFPLWIGRIFVLAICGIFFDYSITRFIRKYKEQ